MTDSIVEIFLHRGESGSVSPPSAPGFNPILPDDDPDEGEVPEESYDLIGDPLALKYINAKQEESLRRIAVHFVYEKDGLYYLRAFCFERHAPRLFRGDRIKMMTDLTTGEVIEPPDIVQRLTGLATQLSTPDGTENAIRRLKPGILILLFLSRCDGLVHPSEVQVMLEYIDGECGNAGVNDEAAKAHLRRLQPDPASYATAVSLLAKRDPNELRRTARFARRLIDADGAISHEEHAFAAAIAQAIRS